MYEKRKLEEMLILRFCKELKKNGEYRDRDVNINLEKI